MKKLTKKITIATALLCGGLLASVGFGNVNTTTAFAAESEQVETVFEVKSASLRIPDATYGEGIRFKIVMDKDTYIKKEVANLTTGILVIPTSALGESELTANLENSAMKKVEGVTWTVSEEDASFMELYVHLYDIPATEYATEVSIRAYVNGTDLLTDVATSSVAEAADWLYDNDTTLTAEEKATLQATYLTYDVVYHDGDNVTEADGIYGEKISAPTAPEKEGYTFDGWWNNGYTAEWDFDETTIGGVETNLYAKWDINEYSVTVIRADGTQKVEKFTVENRDTVLAGIKLTDNTAQYTYTWETALPTQLALNDTQVFTETRTVNKYTVTLIKANGEANTTLTDIPYGTTAAAVYAENMIPTYAGRTFDGWYLGDVKVEETDIVESDLTLTAKWTVADKITLIDAATQASLFSNNFVLESDKDKWSPMSWGNKGVTYTTETDSTHGTVVTGATATAYQWGWVNFNDGVKTSDETAISDLYNHWKVKLAGLDKVVFYVYNSQVNPHKIKLMSANAGIDAFGAVTLEQGWNTIVVDAAKFLNVFGSEASGNPYIFINFYTADGSSQVGGSTSATFKFSSFYGYTTAGYEQYLAEIEAAKQAKIQEIKNLIDALPAVDTLEYGTVELNAKVAQIQEGYALLGAEITNYAEFEAFYAVYKDLPTMLLDADADFAKFSSAKVTDDATGGHVGFSGMASTFKKETDATHGTVVQAKATAHNWTGIGYVSFNEGMTAEETLAHWTKQLEGLDKIVFYVYNGYTSDLNIGIRKGDTSKITGNTMCAMNAWTMVTVDVPTFLNGMNGGSAPYLGFADNGNPNLTGATFKFTSFVGYTNAQYTAAFPTA